MREESVTSKCWQNNMNYTNVVVKLFPVTVVVTRD